MCSRLAMMHSRAIGRLESWKAESWARETLGGLRRTPVSQPGRGHAAVPLHKCGWRSPTLASRTATLLGALATALRCREINMSVVVLIDSGVFQDFAFGQI